MIERLVIIGYRFTFIIQLLNVMLCRFLSIIYVSHRLFVSSLISQSNKLSYQIIVRFLTIIRVSLMLSKMPIAETDTARVIVEIRHSIIATLTN